MTTFENRQQSVRQRLFADNNVFGEYPVDNDHVIISMLKQGYVVSSIPEDKPCHIDVSLIAMPVCHIC